MSVCKECRDNYLYKIYIGCLAAYDGDVKQAGIYFNRIIMNSKDPRPILVLINSMINGDCTECEKYRELYESYIN